MKSICIKTNNNNLLNYLLNELNYLEIDNVFFSLNKFKNYKNIIIHYRGNDDSSFIYQISCILSCLVLDELEEKLLEKIILKHYFYFELSDKKEIINICHDIFSDDFNKYFDKRYKCLINDFSFYLLDNKNIVLSGFINFRIKNYLLILEEIIDQAVNSYILEKEYLEFISLLKLYINSQNTNCEFVHLIYSNKESFLLDTDKNKIHIPDNIFKVKYLSDITFSSNDYTLNSLLYLLPKKIYIHLIDISIDEFINTLSLIFENRIKLCTDCNICTIYKYTKDKKTIIKK